MAVQRAAAAGWRAMLCGVPLALLAAGTVMAGPRQDGHPAPPSAAEAGAAGQVSERTAALAGEQRRLTAASARLTWLRTRAEVLAERYDRAVTAEQQAGAAYRAAAGRLAAARRAQKLSRARLAAQAAADYESGGGLSPAAVMFGDSRGPRDYLAEASMQDLLAGHRAEMLAKSQAASLVAGVFQRQAADLLTAEQADLRAVSALKMAVRGAVRRQLAAVSSARSARSRLAGELSIAQANEAAVEAAQQAGVAAQADAAAQRAAAAGGIAQVTNTGAPAQAPSWARGAGASAALGDIAANWALRQLGKPYQWGAAGPGSYDCSGLTMEAWSHAGVQLAHWTGYQWGSGPHIPVDQLQRGDLLFYATNTSDPGTIHHVGIYIGNGMMVDAPYTGAFVRTESIYRPGGLIGATRPA